MSEVEDAAQKAVESGDDARLNSLVAIVVAFAATFMALCNVKDGNIVQAMDQAQAHGVDAWAYYQAKGTKENLAQATAEQLTLEREVAPSLTPEARALYAKRIAEYEAKAKLYASDKEKIKAQAQGFAEEYDRLNVHDDQFDAAEACLSVSIALFGVTALTRKRWLFGFGAALLALGTVLGVAGFLKLGLHPDFFARVLG
jgi:hypothetical protein